MFPHEPSDTFRTIKRKQPDGSVRLEARNFYTSPPKKGTNTPGVLFGPYPEHIPDPYERKERLNKEKNSKFRGMSHDAPFVPMERGGKTFNKDADIYGGDFKAPPPKRSVSQKFPKQDMPFRPPNPSHGTIGNFPEYIPNPQPVVKRKPPSTLEPWRATTTVKTVPSVSIVSNIKNIRAEYPMLRRLN